MHDSFMMTRMPMNSRLLLSSSSFSDVSMWMRNIDQHAPSNVIRMLVANKQDLPSSRRVVTEEEGRKLAEDFGGLPYMETSAKNDVNVSEMFFAMTKLIKERFYDEPLRREVVEDQDATSGKKTTKKTAVSKSLLPGGGGRRSAQAEEDEAGEKKRCAGCSRT